jgi:hypothetical protein
MARAAAAQPRDDPEGRLPSAQVPPPRAVLENAVQLSMVSGAQWHEILIVLAPDTDVGEVMQVPTARAPDPIADQALW